MADNLRLRHAIVRCIRRFLEDQHGFIEVGGVGRPCEVAVAGCGAKLVQLNRLAGAPRPAAPARLPPHPPPAGGDAHPDALHARGRP